MVKKKTSKKTSDKSPAVASVVKTEPETVEEVGTEAVEPEAEGTELMGYEMVDIFAIGPGCFVSGLNDEQLRRRAHRLELVEDDDDVDMRIYKSTDSMQFKVGETVVLNPADIPKASRHAVLLKG